MSSYLFGILFVFGLSYLIWWASTLLDNTDRTEIAIENLVKSVGGYNVFIKRLSKPKQALSRFAVTFTDEDGHQVQRRIHIVENEQGMAREIAWADIPVEGHMSSVLSSKEQIISDLSAENAALRAQLATLQLVDTSAEETIVE